MALGVGLLGVIHPPLHSLSYSAYSPVVEPLQMWLQTCRARSWPTYPPAAVDWLEAPEIDGGSPDSMGPDGVVEGAEGQGFWIALPGASLSYFAVLPLSFSFSPGRHRPLRITPEIA